jgi:hypothetical protein
MRRLYAGMLAPLLVLLLALPSQAAEATLLKVDATVGGSDITDARPLVLRPNDATVVTLQVTNISDRPLTIRSARLEGRAFGLTFYSVTTRLDLTLAPNATGTRRFAIDLSDIDGQALGFVPGRLSLLNRDRAALWSADRTTDVRGSIASTYGVFGLLLIVGTIGLWTSLLLRQRRSGPPVGPFERGLRHAVPGLATGLALTWTVGALGLAAPTAGLALTLMTMIGVLSAAAGSLSGRGPTTDFDAYDAAQMREAMKRQIRPAGPGRES